jgi:hypothetical protein
MTRKTTEIEPKKTLPAANVDARSAEFGRVADRALAAEIRR